MLPYFISIQHEGLLMQSLLDLLNFGKAAMRLGLGEDYLSLIRASDNTMLPDSEIEFELRTRMLNLIER